MTFNSNRKAALAVTAGLVGALTLGGAAVAVPQAAFAEEAGASVQSVSPLQAAKLYQAKDGNGKYIKVQDEMELPKGSVLVPVSLVINGVPTQVTNNGDPNNGDPEPGYSLNYYATDANGNKTGTAMTGTAVKSATPGVYVVEVSKDGETWSMKFSVAVSSLKGAVAYEGDDVSDTTFTFDGSALTVNFVANGKKLVKNTDYAVDYYKDNVKISESDVKDAGTYTAVLTGYNDYKDSHANVVFTIDKLDLSKANVSADDVKSGSTEPLVKINGKVNSGIGLKKSFSGKAGDAEKSGTWTGLKGQWEVTVTSGDEKNVTGTATATFNAVSRLASDFTYAGSNFSSFGTKDTAAVIDLSEDEAFSAKDIAVKDGSTVLKASNYDVTYADAEGNAVSDLSKAGTYLVTVRVKPGKDYTLGGSGSFFVKVTNGKIDADQSVTFKVDGKVVKGSDSVTFDGKDALDRLSVEVKDAEGAVLTEGEDYELLVTNGAEKVDSAVDAGEYTVTVVLKGYDFSSADRAAQLTLTVDPLAVAPLAATVAYSGSEVAVPAVQFKSGDETLTLDPSLYEVVSISYLGEKGDSTPQIVEAMDKAGFYHVTLQLTDAAKGNYALDASPMTVEVRKASSFTDVVPEAWYATSVESAFNLGYVHGAGNTGLFLPGANITRADAIGILFNMAGGEKGFTNDELGYTESFGYDTGFSDVDGNAYYAKALAWAHKYGVANGNGGKFNPSATLTREEFATFLANYAKAKGDYKPASEDALAALKDGASVSAWAKDSANWAVANKIMGKNGTLDATNTITRAEVAAMAVSYQPEAVTTPVRPGDKTEADPLA